MDVSFYLTVNSNGTIRMNKTRPDVKWDEISILCKLAIPKEIFRKPQLSATITIPESAVSPSLITADVEENIRKAIQTAAGMEVRISFDPINPEA